MNPTNHARERASTPQSISIRTFATQSSAHLRMVQLAFWKRPGVFLVSVALPIFFGISLPLSIANSSLPNHDTDAMRSVVGFMAFAYFFATYNVIQAMASRRDSLFFKRQVCSGVRPAPIFLGEIVSGLIPALGVSLLLWIFGAIVLGLGTPSSPLTLIAAASVGAVMFGSLGVLIAGVVPSAEVGMLIAAPLMLAFLYLSNLMNIALPAAVSEWTQWLPLSLLVTLFRYSFGTGSTSTISALISLLALIVWAALIFGAGLKLFRWNPRRR